MSIIVDKYVYPTSDITVLASSNVTADFSSSDVNNPGAAPNIGTAPAGSFFLLLLDTKRLPQTHADRYLCIMPHVGVLTH